MRFTFNDIELNLTAGLLIKDGQTISIRAKTLLVLKYLISHQDKIVEKKEILATVWHDVVVQEQVLVQSIKEIRDLLGNHVIKTYPRRGYQWTVELTEINKKTTFSSKTLTSVLLGRAIPLIMVTVIGIFSYYSLKNPSTSLNDAHFSVIFLPVINDMPDDIHNWVPLEGMDYLNETLSQTSQLNVIAEEPLMTGGLQGTELNNIAIKKRVNLVVNTRLLGYPQDFQLHYSLHLEHSIERGIIFSKTVGNGFDQLVQKIAHRFDKISPQTIKPYVSDFSNEAFALGIEHYLQREYQPAVTFFSSALQSNDNLLAARRYLAASYINSGNAEQGISLMKKNIQQAQIKHDYREEIRSNLMVGVLLINQYQESRSNNANLLEAEQYIKASKKLSQQHKDSLFSAYANEELGKIKRLEKQYPQAIILLKKALNIYQSFSSDYGQTRPLIELALVASAQNKHQETNHYFELATTIANNHGVATNTVAILLAQAQVQQDKGNNGNTVDIAQQALETALQAKNNLLTARVKSWLNNNRHYEIN